MKPEPASLSKSSQTSRTAPTRGFWFMRDIPVIFWMVITVLATILHRFLPEPRWLMMHLLFLGVVTQVILIFSQHFSFALTRTPHTLRNRRIQNIRLAAANIAIITVVVGVISSTLTVTIVGAVLLIAVVLWHGIELAHRIRKALPNRFGSTIRYYVVSAFALVGGISIAIWMLTESVTNFDGRLTMAHAITNILGWVGLTVAGTVVTLWPTMLRTQIDPQATRWANISLPLLALGLIVSATGAVFAEPILLVIGVVIYLGGLSLILAMMIRVAKKKPPYAFATLSVAAAFIWWILITGLFGYQVIAAIVTDEPFYTIKTAFDALTPFWAAGFLAQIVIGALSYLVPVLIAGGPIPVRVGTATLNSGHLWRISLANLALVLSLFPLPSLTLVIITILFLIAVSSFIPLFILAISRQVRAKKSPENFATVEPYPALYRGQGAGRAMTSLIIVAVVTVASATFVPEQFGPIEPLFGAQSNVTPDDSSAPIHRVQVEAADMRFTPDNIEVPHGSRLIIELTNTDSSQVHDLVFENGAGGSRLAPGASEEIDVGVITDDLEGWCSIIGHRQMGMVMNITVTGDPDTGDDSGHTHPLPENTDGSEDTIEYIDLSVDPEPNFSAHPAELSPHASHNGQTTHTVELNVTEQLHEVAPGIYRTLWTFGGKAPGPTLHGKVGDTFIVTLTNDGTIGHSIDFHAGALAPDKPMRTIAPGESLTYTFTADRAGMWMYHCATDPMTAHIANGMFGAVIIEPNDLPEVDHSFVLIQSELYLGPQNSEVSFDKLAREQPDLVVFNGYANQYMYRPLEVTTGDRVRVWVLNVGPNRNSSFHIIGGQFDTVYSEGKYLLNRSTDSGSQALGLFPAQAGFVELVFPETGNYPFVSHIMIDAERGARGIFHVTD